MFSDYSNQSQDSGHCCVLNSEQLSKRNELYNTMNYQLQNLQAHTLNMKINTNYIQTVSYMISTGPKEIWLSAHSLKKML